MMMGAFDRARRVRRAHIFF